MILRFVLLLLPLSLFASSGKEVDYDILDRIVNFSIFAFLLWYLVANKVKIAYNDRIKSISDRLESVQLALKNTEQKRELAKKKVQKAKEDAKNLLVSSEQELKIMVAKLHEGANSDIANMEKAHDDRISIEKRHMRRDVISEVLDELFEDNSSVIDRKEFVDIILKKVA